MATSSHRVSLAERIRRLLLAARPNTYCDKCITRTLVVGDWRAVRATIRADLARNGYARARGVCFLCRLTRQVTWAVP